MANEENSVFVGRRPTMNYVMATMMILNKGEECTVKARGRAISQSLLCVGRPLQITRRKNAHCSS